MLSNDIRKNSIQNGNLKNQKLSEEKTYLEHKYAVTFRNKKRNFDGFGKDCCSLGRCNRLDYIQGEICLQKPRVLRIIDSET